MPLFLQHWSFGKHFAYQEASYRKGRYGPAYEIVIKLALHFLSEWKRTPRPCRRW